MADIDTRPVAARRHPVGSDPARREGTGCAQLSRPQCGFMAQPVSHLGRQLHWRMHVQMSRVQTPSKAPPRRSITIDHDLGAISPKTRQRIRLRMERDRAPAAASGRRFLSCWRGGRCMRLALGTPKRLPQLVRRHIPYPAESATQVDKPSGLRCVQQPGLVLTPTR
jgi:hypothetical protein